VAGVYIFISDTGLMKLGGTKGTGTARVVQTAKTVFMFPVQQSQG